MLKPPYKVHTEYQVIIYVGDTTDEVEIRYHFTKYEIAVSSYEEEVRKANGNYLVELVHVVETRQTKETNNFESQYYTLGINK